VSHPSASARHPATSRPGGPDGGTGAGAHTGNAPATTGTQSGGVNLKEALQLLAQAGLRPASGEPPTLQQVIDGLCAISSHDGLTGLSNRRQFDGALQKEIERSTRSGESFGLLLIDIDRFKEINDAHGHIVGDAVLKAVAAALTRSFHTTDTVARYGGDEFGVIVVNISAAYLQQLAERVRALIAREAVITGDAGAVDVTVSIGIVCTGAGARAAPAALLGLVDHHLYEAKRLGRNRVHGVAAPSTAVTAAERATLSTIDVANGG